MNFWTAKEPKCKTGSPWHLPYINWMNVQGEYILDAAIQTVKNP